MLVCIPTNGNAGLDDIVSEHFGSAPFFTVYDSESDEVKVIENRNAGHDHGTCHPMNQLTRFRLDGIVCAGMGRRAVEALSTEGIKVYEAGADRVSEIVHKVKAGDLSEIDPSRACRGHGQRQARTGQPGSGPQPGSGRGSGWGQGQGRGSGRGEGRGRGGHGRGDGSAG